MDLYSIISKIKNFYKRKNIYAENILYSKTFYGGRKKACAALSRITTSFDVILFLIRNGYFLEPCTIMRQCLEQLAWILYVNQFTEENYKQKEPQSCISNMKTHYKWVGSLYGRLSKYSHLTEDVQYLYFLSNNKIVIKSINRSFNILKYFVDILYLYHNIFQTFIINTFENQMEQKDIYEVFDLEAQEIKKIKSLIETKLKKINDI